MEAKELREVLKQREKRTLEYKRAWDNVPGNLFETICAFLNREGGLIVLGAEDNGEIKKGVSPDAAYQMCRDISNMSNNPQKLSPTFLLQPEEVEIDGKKVIVVYVPCSSQVHSTAGKVYDRSSDGDYVLKTDAEISAAYLRKSQAYSENKVYPYMRMEHLQEKTIRKAKKLIKEMYPKHPWLKLSTMEMLKQANLYREDLSGGEGGFSLAALMLFGKQEAIQSMLPYYRIDAVVRLNDVDRYDDRFTSFGNIIDGYDDLMEFMRKHLPDPFYMEDDQRKSLLTLIFREVIANMLVHREYLNPTFTTIEIGREGIVIKNANKPLHSGPVTLRNYVRHPKNPHISNFFVQMGRAEYLGTGIRNLYKYVPIYTGGEPEIIEGDVFEVRMKLPKGFWSGEEKETESVMGNDVIENVIENVIEKRGIKKSQLTTRQLGIIQRLIETGKKYVPGVVLENVPENVIENVTENDIVNNVETLESLAAMCGRSTRTIHRDIVGLKELGLVRRDGGDLGGIWVVLTSEGMK